MEYDQNIFGHTLSISEYRDNIINWKYFQYVTLLFTEIYLDMYFSNSKKLLSDLNQFVDYMKESTQIGTELDEIKFQLENHKKVVSDDETLVYEIKRKLSTITDRLAVLDSAGATS